ncbi:MAG TPA: HNH endonuclease [Acidimicrobiia bacterium]|nr:HNH endonuclease [Acidimicrobiia bacterium]
MHHVLPWSQGRSTDPDNLITLCWYHHQIVVHQQGVSPNPTPTTDETDSPGPAVPTRRLPPGPTLPHPRAWHRPIMTR